ncbi:CBS domain-containing protein [Blastococcus haudaquaticus]|nr:CBS domain-containing protein [Blastococcus haudaquaticus]
MAVPIATIEPEAHLAAASYLIKRSRASVLVVTGDGGQPVATVTAVDIGRAIADGRDVELTRIRQVVTRKPPTVEVHATAADAVRLMLAAGVQCLPVLDGSRLVGTVQLDDLRPAVRMPEPQVHR